MKWTVHRTLNQKTGYVVNKKNKTAYCFWWPGSINFKRYGLELCQPHWYDFGNDLHSHVPKYDRNTRKACLEAIYERYWYEFL